MSIMGIVLLVLGVVYVTRRPKIARLTQDAFPGVASGQFAAWKRAELRSIDVFLAATWGQFFVFAILGVALVSSLAQDAAERLAAPFTLVQAIGLFVGLIVSAIYGSRAQKLREAFPSSADIPSDIGGAFSVAPSGGNRWAVVGRMLGVVALLPGVGLVFSPLALIAGALALRTLRQDPAAGYRGSALFALGSGAASLLLYGGMMVSLMLRS